MIEIKQVEAGYQVSGSAFQEVFQSRFKATMAAHALAFGDATRSGRPVPILLPDDWGDTILIQPARPPAAGRTTRG